MAQILNKAVLLNVGAFVANNNIRRSVASFAANYQSVSGATVDSSSTILPGATYTYTPISPCAVLTLGTSGIVIADITLAGVTVPVTRTQVTYRQIVTQLLVLDDTVSQVVLTNPDTVNPVSITIVQG